MTEKPKSTVVTGVEMFRKLLDQVGSCDEQYRRTAARCRPEKSSAVKYCHKPGSIKPHTDYKAEVYVLSKEEGGRHTPLLIAIVRSSTSGQQT